MILIYSFRLLSGVNTKDGSCVLIIKYSCTDTIYVYMYDYMMIIP